MIHLYANFDGVRVIEPEKRDGYWLTLDAVAALVEPRHEGIGGPARIRFFGPDPAWPVATHFLALGTDHEVDERVLTFGDGWGFELRRPFDGGDLVHEEFAVAESGFAEDQDEVWDALSDAVVSHWQTPFGPVLNFVPKHMMQTLHQRERLAKTLGMERR